MRIKHKKVVVLESLTVIMRALICLARLTMAIVIMNLQSTKMSGLRARICFRRGATLR